MAGGRSRTYGTAWGVGRSGSAVHRATGGRGSGRLRGAGDVPAPRSAPPDATDRGGQTAVNVLIEDPPVLLAAIRATGGLPVERTDSRAVDAARRRAESAGRALMTCRTGGSYKRVSGRGLVLGWLPV